MRKCSLVQRCKKTVKYSHTRLWALGTELIIVSWQSAHRWLSHKTSGRLPWVSTRPTVTFTAKEINPPRLILTYTAWWLRHTGVRMMLTFFYWLFIDLLLMKNLSPSSSRCQENVKSPFLNNFVNCCQFCWIWKRSVVQEPIVMCGNWLKILLCLHRIDILFTVLTLHLAVRNLGLSHGGGHGADTASNSGNYICYFCRWQFILSDIF